MASTFSVLLSSSGSSGFKSSRVKRLSSAICFLVVVAAAAVPVAVAADAKY